MKKKTSGFNLTAWFLDVIGDIVGQLVRRHDYFKFMCVNVGIPNWTAPIVYLIGSGVFTEHKKEEDANNVKTQAKPKNKKRNAVVPAIEI